MRQQSESWKRLRRATLERAHRTAIEPLTPLYTIYVGVCAVYLAGFLHFNFFSNNADLNWLTGSMLVVVAIAGVLIPVLTGSVLALSLANQRLQMLVDE